MNRLKEIRTKKGLSLEQVGKGVGLATNTISRYETGKREPKLETWNKRAERNNEWHVGDVVCLENHDQNFKDFGMIVQEPISGRYSVASLNGVPGVLSGDGYFSDQVNVQYKEINRMIESFKDVWDCVEKVNAHLVVED